MYRVTERGGGRPHSPLSFRTGVVRNLSGRDSHLSGHSPPCVVDPVQSLYRMTAESVVISYCHFPERFSTPRIYSPVILTGIVRSPSGRDSHLSGHSPPCVVDPVQSLYRMTAESVVISYCHFPDALFNTPDLLPCHSYRDCTEPIWQG